MNLNECYPRFIVHDDHNRALEFKVTGKLYQRKWLNPPPKYLSAGGWKNISRYAYAHGLLAFVEHSIDGRAKEEINTPDLDQIVLPGELDLYFGPKNARHRRAG